MPRYIQIGQRALRGPDGQLLPPCPIYILEEEAEEIGLEYEDEEMVTGRIIQIFVYSLPPRSWTDNSGAPVLATRHEVPLQR